MVIVRVGSVPDPGTDAEPGALGRGRASTRAVEVAAALVEERRASVRIALEAGNAHETD